MADTFTLRVQVVIERRDEHGGFTGDRLSINDEQELDVRSFAEVASTLGRFHDLGNALRQERSAKDPAENDS